MNKLEELFNKMYDEQNNSHKPVVSGKQPTTQGIRAVATRYANNFQDLHKGELTTLDLRESFISGAEWYKSFTAAGVCSGSDKTT